MAQKRFDRAPNDEKWPACGQWKRVKMFDDTITARLKCPECGCIALLNDHEIAAGGAVTPSVVCPRPDCDYHESGVVLAGWLD